MAAKEMNVGYIRATFAYNYFGAIFVYGKKSYDFIVRTFRIKLYLTMLICYAERFYRGLPAFTTFPLKSTSLPSDSAHIWQYQSAKYLSPSLYGIITDMFLPFLIARI